MDYQSAAAICRTSMMTPDVDDNVILTEQHDSIEAIDNIDRGNEIDIQVDTFGTLIPNSAMAKIIDSMDDGGPHELVTPLSVRESAQAIAASRIFGSAEDEEVNDAAIAANRDSSTQSNYHNDDNDSDEEFEILPNLANLVAASLRDRVVLEQLEEIKLLKKQLIASREVVITGKDGTPVYAQGDFAKGKFNWDMHSCGQEQGGSVFWDVGLKMKRFESSIPLQNLTHIEIRIGGVLYCTSEEVEGINTALGIRPGNYFDHNQVSDMKRSVVCEFNPEDDFLGRNAFLTFHMTGFPRDPWRSLQSVAMLSRSNALIQQHREEEREERREARRRERIEAGLLHIDDNEWEDSDHEEEDESEPFDAYNTSPIH
jgi:hypothetical protein